MNHIKIGLQYWMPKHLLTVIAGAIASRKLGFLTQILIKLFIKLYRVDMSEAILSDTKDYATFNDFFTRKLKEEVRPIDTTLNHLVFPADARVSQFGKILTNAHQHGALIQAKGQYYDSVSLLGGDEALANLFHEGKFTTFYLSPQDYHCVHMPCDGTLKQMTYIPGTLFSVSPLTAENIPNLFARNERLVTVFDTPYGLMAQILVGATIVGSIETTWAGVITPPRRENIKSWFYPSTGADAIHLKKGEQMGAFKLGSTVINLFANPELKFSEEMALSMKTKVGQFYLYK